ASPRQSAATRIPDGLLRPGAVGGFEDIVNRCLACEKTLRGLTECRVDIACRPRRVAGYGDPADVREKGLVCLVEGRFRPGLERSCVIVWRYLAQNFCCERILLLSSDEVDECSGRGHIL